MRYHKLGNSDLQISEISFGCSSLEQNHPANSDLIRRAFDQGINFFDTADLYDKGWNEESVGKAVKDLPEDVLVSTKVGNQWRPDGSGWEWNPSKEHMLTAVDQSLKRLQIDTIDLYQLHGGTLEDPIDEIIETFERLQDTGKIRYYGISSIRPNVIREYVKRSNISSVMMQYSLLDRRPEETCLDLLHDAGISVLCRGTLAKGLLIDKPSKATLGYSEEDVSRMQQAVNTSGNPIAASLGFVLTHPAVASAVVGTRTPEQLEEVVEGYRKREAISEKNLEELKNLLEPNVYKKHR
ncbi:MAG: aldo/keto reductase [Balneolaceae bacterium]